MKFKKKIVRKMNIFLSENKLCVKEHANVNQLDL